MKKQQFDLRNGSLLVLEVANISLPPKTPNHTMGNQPPNHKILSPTQTYDLSIKPFSFYFLREMMTYPASVVYSMSISVSIYDLIRLKLLT
jgi:hypothetical protein